MSSPHQGFQREFEVPPALFRHGMNLWPPFMPAGIRVTRVTTDFREIDVTLRPGVCSTAM